MRTLKGKIVVQIPLSSSDSLITSYDHIRKGFVVLTGSDQIQKDEEVLFGNNFEEVELPGNVKTTYYFMDESNVKVIFEKSKKPVQNFLTLVSNEVVNE